MLMVVGMSDVMETILRWKSRKVCNVYKHACQLRGYPTPRYEKQKWAREDGKSSQYVAQLLAHK